LVFEFTDLLESTAFIPPEAPDAARELAAVAPDASAAYDWTAMAGILDSIDETDLSDSSALDALIADADEVGRRIESHATRECM
jgi:hypothetical protein